MHARPTAGLALLPFAAVCLLAGACSRDVSGPGEALNSLGSASNGISMGTDSVASFPNTETPPASDSIVGNSITNAGTASSETRLSLRKPTWSIR